jgi:hypothetical protein
MSEQLRDRHLVKEWLHYARRTDDPAGDLIADMARDRDLPPLFRNIGHMRSYLQQEGACREALDAVPVVWRRYNGWLTRNPAGKPIPAQSQSTRR